MGLPTIAKEPEKPKKVETKKVEPTATATSTKRPQPKKKKHTTRMSIMSAIGEPSITDDNPLYGKK